MSTPTALVVAAAGVLAVGGLWLSDGDGDVRVTAEFRDAAGLRGGSQVKVGGVPVGQVRSLKVTPRDTARVVFSFPADGAPVLHADARAQIRPANLLGEKYVDLRPGTAARPLLRDRRIALSRTSTPVELDDVLDVLEPRTRARLGVLVREAGVALGGRGDDLETLLRGLPPAAGDLRELAEQAATDVGALRDLLRRSDRVVAAVQREHAGLEQLVDAGAGALEATAARRTELAATIAEAPGMLARLRATLRQLDRTGDALRPAATGLRVTAPELVRTLTALPGFTTAARPALDAVRDAAPQLTQLGRRGTPTVRRLRRSAKELDALAGAADALTGTLDRGTPDLLGLMEGWAHAIQQRDAAGHMFRIGATMAPEFATALAAYVSPPGRRKRRTGRERPRPVIVPVPTAPRPAVPEVRVPPVVEQLVDPVGDTVDGAKDLLDYLLAP